MKFENPKIGTKNLVQKFAKLISASDDTELELIVEARRIFQLICERNKDISVEAREEIETQIDNLMAEQEAIKCGEEADLEGQSLQN